MKNINGYTVTLWILGFIVVIIMTEEFYQHNESWNKIRRQGYRPVLMSGDNVANQSQSPHWKSVNDQGIVSNSYWNPYIFGGMPEVFSGVQHILAAFVMSITGLALNHYHQWFYIIDLLPIFFVLWKFHLGLPVTPGEIATDREDQKIFRWLLYSIAGWLLFYWFYVEIR